jgi:hypothetical protein
MAKAFSIREVELKPGIAEDQFERFLRDEFPQQPQFPGARSYVLKGERGQRAGKYLWVMEWETVERWRETWPNGEPSDELRRWTEAHQSGSGLSDYVDVPGGIGTAYTAYREVGVSGR